MNVIDRIKVTQDRNRQGLEALADLTDQTVAEVEADVCAPDPLPCGCILGAQLCNEARKLLDARTDAQSNALNATGEGVDSAWRKYKEVWLQFDTHLEQRKEAA